VLDPAALGVDSATLVRRLVSGSGRARAQPELVESHAEVVGATPEDRGEHPEVVTTNCQQTTVEVLSLQLDRRRVP